MELSKIYISYFYTIRFFTPNMVPLSTAVWDPKWYHDFKDQSYFFYDKRHVVNGLRINPLVPDKHCHGLCSGPDNCIDGKDPNTCRFLRAYTDQLQSVNFDHLMNAIKMVCNAATIYIQGVTDLQPIPVIMVHEKPDNPCSERWPIMKWFKANGVDIQELDYRPLK